MKVSDLVAALLAYPQEAEVECQGTSVRVTPRSVGLLGDLRADTYIDNIGEIITTEDVWSFEDCSDDTVIILTK